MISALNRLPLQQFDSWSALVALLHAAMVHVALRDVRHGGVLGRSLRLFAVEPQTL